MLCNWWDLAILGLGVLYPVRSGFLYCLGVFPGFEILKSCSSSLGPFFFFFLIIFSSLIFFSIHLFSHPKKRTASEARSCFTQLLSLVEVISYLYLF